MGGTFITGVGNGGTFIIGVGNGGIFTAGGGIIGGAWITRGGGIGVAAMNSFLRSTIRGSAPSPYCSIIPRMSNSSRRLRRCCSRGIAKYDFTSADDASRLIVLDTVCGLAWGCHPSIQPARIGAAASDANRINAS